MGIEKNRDEKAIEKPKRQMTEKQKEALRKGREKAHERLRQAREELKQKEEPKRNVEFDSSSEEEVKVVYEK